ncbi:DUF192 domain-containing protein [Candidatus Auribacterota bacterium]
MKISFNHCRYFIFLFFLVLGEKEAQSVQYQPLKKEGNRDFLVQLEKISIGGKIFFLELATDNNSRTKGLMWRKGLRPDQGMLFVFPNKKIRKFWMKHTSFDITIIFLDDQREIVDIQEMVAEPAKTKNESLKDYEKRLKSYLSAKPAQFVIELQGGILQVIDIKIGDKLNLDVKRLKALAE